MLAWALHPVGRIAAGPHPIFNVYYLVISLDARLPFGLLLFGGRVCVLEKNGLLHNRELYCFEDDDWPRCLLCGVQEMRNREGSSGVV